MTPPTIHLTERRTVVRRLPRADAADLAARFRHVVELAPAADRGRYRLTARGYVGTFRTAGRVWHVRPKLGWRGLHHLLDSPTGSGEPGGDWPSEVASLAADRLAALLDERAAAGLLRGYVERSEEAATVRGRIELAKQARDAHRGTGRFHVVADEFTPDVPANRAAVAAANRLLAVPGLRPNTRAALGHALAAFAGVSDTPVSPADLDPFDPRLAAYRPLLSWCRVVLAAFDRNGPAFLFKLEHLFQSHITRLLEPRAGWTADAEPAVRLADPTGRHPDVTLVPDLVVRDPVGRPRAVWDVKWKVLSAAGPDPPDVHQALGYAAALGVADAGLVYPGRRFTSHTLVPAGGTVRLHVVTHRLSGDPAALSRSAKRLAARLFRPSRSPGV